MKESLFAEKLSQLKDVHNVDECVHCPGQKKVSEEYNG